MNPETELDLIWGCAAIAKVIRKTPKSTYHLLEAGRLPAKKEGRWVARRADLERHFTTQGEKAA